ncbi:MAG: dihydrofolate reductase [Bacteroidota bacterium]|nr:dihydrofolate reductase [Bacteroidota bacterium]
MKRSLTLVSIIGMSIILFAGKLPDPPEKKPAMPQAAFKWQTEQFGDSRILRYKVPGFDELSLNQKKMIYYLSQAALCGRDITYDQNCKYNLLVRKTLESVVMQYTGDKNAPEYLKLMTYLKEVWFNNGIHHYYSSDKLIPEFSKEYLSGLLKSTGKKNLPLDKDQTLSQFITEITRIIFDPSIAPKRVCLENGKDLILNSSCNFYDGVTQKEAEDFYYKLKEKDKKEGNDTLIAYGLNSKLVKENGVVTEKKWKTDGMYAPALIHVIYWLNMAASVSESKEQKESIYKLINYYRTGDLGLWDEYNILWVKDINSKVDFVNGFIEVYGDPLAKKAGWESVVNFKDEEATKRTEILSRNALYFEEHSPVDPRFKKKDVKGITAKVITVAQLGGECHPTTPIGINLPNAQWIRKEYGSKSVTMDNITYAYDQSSLGNGFLEEFAASPQEIENAKKYSYIAGNLNTDLHECLGHGSGQMLPGVTAESLKNYHSTIEEARADLFALYNVMDPKLKEVGLVTSPAVATTEYDSFIRNGLFTQLVRVKPGKTIEEAHMRDRSLIAHWVYEKGKDANVIEKFSRDGKTYFRINNYTALRDLFGQLLREIQRITSEGDYTAAKNLVETYGVQVDADLHKEVLERYKKLNIAPYAGFINPVFEPVMKGETLTDVRVTYPSDFTKQMLEYSSKYSFLSPR